MSKWQLPTQKGTELWPSATRSPVKVVFEGVPAGSPQARELLKRFGGQINQFYLGAAQSYALGVVEQSGTRRESPDLVMSYSNNRGQETVRVKPSARLVTRRAPVIPPTDFWPWAIISLDLVDTQLALGGLNLSSACHFVSPKISEIPGSLVDVVDGFVYYTSYRTEPIGGLTLYAPLPVDEPVLVGESVRPGARNMYLADMRRFQGMSHAVLDVYGVLQIQEENLPQKVILGNAEPRLATEPQPEAAGFRTGIVYNVDSAGWLPEPPATTFNRETKRWEWPDGTDQIVVMTGTGYAPDGEGGFDLVNLWFRWTLNTQNNYIPAFSGVLPAPLNLRVAMLKGLPELGYALADSDFFSPAWGFPDEPVFGFEMATSVQGLIGSQIDQAPGNAFGALRMGALIFDLQKGIASFDSV